MTQSPPNSLHYMGFGVNPIVGEARVTGEVSVVAFPKYASFEPGIEITTEDDIGHTGNETNLLGKERISASAAPAFEDKIRLGEGIEDMVYMLLGNVTGPTDPLTNASSSYKYVFDVDDEITDERPWCTVINGFNWSTAAAETYIEAMVNSIEFQLGTDKPPSYKVTFLSDFPLYNQTEPTLTFPETETKFKAEQGSIYIGEVADNYNALTNSANLVDCYTNCTLTLNNNLEKAQCGGTTFGEVDKQRKAMTGSGSITMDYNATNMTMEALWATGSTSGTVVSGDGLYKQILIKYTGKAIETIADPSATVYADMEIRLPKVEIGEISSPRGGDGNKTIEVPFDLVTDISVMGETPAEITIITPLDALNYGSAGV